MPLYEQTKVLIKGVTIVWDGITRPEMLEAANGQPPGQKWNVKVVVPPNSPDLPLLSQLVNEELAAGEFRGQMPNGGIFPIGTAGPQEFGGGFAGWAVLNCTTYRQPQVFDEAGAVMQPMQYAQAIFPGQSIDVLVHCKTYNNKSKGVAARLDGLGVNVSANAQRLDIGGGNVAGAFGGGGAPAQQPQQPAQYQAPAQQPQQVGGYVAPQQSTNYLPQQ